MTKIFLLSLCFLYCIACKSKYSPETEAILAHYNRLQKAADSSKLVLDFKLSDIKNQEVDFTELSKHKKTLFLVISDESCGVCLEYASDLLKKNPELAKYCKVLITSETNKNFKIIAEQMKPVLAYRVDKKLFNKEIDHLHKPYFFYKDAEVNIATDFFILAPNINDYTSSFIENTLSKFD